MNEDNKRLGSDGRLGTGGVLNIGNALLKNEEEQKTATADPFSPTNTGLPVVIKGADGNRIGNVWSPGQAGLGDALRSIEKGESTKLYLDLKTGNFSNAPVSTMTYKDGKINLNVAKDVANSSWYKQVYGGQAFKDLAKAYALDPTGKTKLEVTRGNEKEEKTINELLEGYVVVVKNL